MQHGAVARPGIRMHRHIGVVALAAAAIAVTFGAIRLLDHKPPPPGPPGMVFIPGGEFTMGNPSPDAPRHETPTRRVRLDGFFIDATDVTNAEFRRFVDATRYITTAEKAPTAEEILRYAVRGAPAP